jgi:hypothetical protein
MYGDRSTRVGFDHGATGAAFESPGNIDSPQKVNMHKIVRTVLTVLALCVLGVGTTQQPVAAAAPKGGCEVTDPSPSPLNLRTEPWGRIVRKLKDGTVVWRTGQTDTDDDGNTWVEVPFRRGGRPAGWVFREYISCRR